MKYRTFCPQHTTYHKDGFLTQDNTPYTLTVKSRQSMRVTIKHDIILLPLPHYFELRYIYLFPPRSYTRKNADMN